MEPVHALSFVKLSPFCTEQTRTSLFNAQATGATRISSGHRRCVDFRSAHTSRSRSVSRLKVSRGLPARPVHSYLVPSAASRAKTQATTSIWRRVLRARLYVVVVALASRSPI
jgi:hypothetical protein